MLLGGQTPAVGAGAGAGSGNRILGGSSRVLGGADFGLGAALLGPLLADAAAPAGASPYCASSDRRSSTPMRPSASVSCRHSGGEGQQESQDSPPA